MTRIRFSQNVIVAAIAILLVHVGVQSADAAARKIGPGASIIGAVSSDTADEERLNVALTSPEDDFINLAAGTYSVRDFQLNVVNADAGNDNAGTVAPMLLIGAPSSYTTVWVGDDFDPTAIGVQKAAMYELGAETFTLAEAANVYAGIFTKNAGSAIPGFLGFDTTFYGSTDHDNEFTAPTGAGQTVSDFFAPDATRIYAFEINIDDGVDLTLEVNTATGAMSLIGDDASPVDFNFYEISSAANGLDDTNWLSLEAQDNTPEFPSGDGTGNGWEASGGVGSHALAEGFLLGNSTLDANASISLGMGYDTAVGDTNLSFSYRTADGRVVDGIVEYVTSAFYSADFDQNLIVDDVDLGIWSTGYGVGTTNAEGDADGDGNVDGNDFLIWQKQVGSTGAPSPAQTLAAAVPEPATILLLTALSPLAVLRSRHLLHRQKVHTKE